MRPVPEYDPKAWLLKALRETAHAMESLVWNVDDAALDRRPEPDEWSCRELVAHMAHMERRYTDWLERMVRTSDAAHRGVRRRLARPGARTRTTTRST